MLKFTKMQVVPAINATSYEEAKKQIQIAGEFADLIHIDIVDGKFAPNVTWGTPEDLKKIAEELKLSGGKFEIQ